MDEPKRPVLAKELQGWANVEVRNRAAHRDPRNDSDENPAQSRRIKARTLR
jgi:hypothetical protein